MQIMIVLSILMKAQINITPGVNCVWRVYPNCFIVFSSSQRDSLLSMRPGVPMPAMAVFLSLLMLGE